VACPTGSSLTLSLKNCHGTGDSGGGQSCAATLSARAAGTWRVAKSTARERLRRPCAVLGGGVVAARPLPPRTVSRWALPDTPCSRHFAGCQPAADFGFVCAYLQKTIKFFVWTGLDLLGLHNSWNVVRPQHPASQPTAVEEIQSTVILGGAAFLPPPPSRAQTPAP
jgi:hypothetical protein